MCTEMWDPDQAITRGVLDAELEGRSAASRYGVTVLEEVRGEPLDVALGQEDADVTTFIGADDWALVEDGWDVDDVLFRDVQPDAPEERALHLERP